MDAYKSLPHRLLEVLRLRLCILSWQHGWSWPLSVWLVVETADPQTDPGLVKQFVGKGHLQICWCCLEWSRGFETSCSFFRSNEFVNQCGDQTSNSRQSTIQLEMTSTASFPTQLVFASGSQTTSNRNHQPVLPSFPTVRPQRGRGAPEFAGRKEIQVLYLKSCTHLHRHKWSPIYC